MKAKEYAEEAKYAFGKHVETQIAIYGDSDARENHFAFFNVLEADQAEWEEFLNDTFDYGEFQPQLFEDEKWNLERYMPLAVMGMGGVWWAPSAAEDEYGGQPEGLLFAELTGDTVETCPLYTVYIDGTATFDEPEKVELTLRQLVDANVR